MWPFTLEMFVTVWSSYIHEKVDFSFLFEDVKFTKDRSNRFYVSKCLTVFKPWADYYALRKIFYFKLLKTI